MAKEINSTALIKQQNVKNIKLAILEKGSATKPEVAEKTGLSVVTCGSILNELTASGEIVEESLRLSSGGRPAMSYRFKANAGNSLCLYAYAENKSNFIRYQILDITGNIKDTGVFQEKTITIQALITRIKKIIQPEIEIKIIIVGIQGCINENIVEFSDLSELSGINVAKEIEAATGICTHVENDMNTIALGLQKNFEDKSLGDTKCPSKNVALLFFPVGQTPAGGFIVDGNILRGSSNLAGELSFFPFNFNKDRQRCTFSNIKNALPVITQLLIATIVFLDPAVIVITGGLSNNLEAETLFKYLQENFHRNQLPKIKILPMVETEYFAGLHKIAVEHLLEA